MAFASDPLTWIFSGAQKELELRMNDPEAYEIYMENKYNRECSNLLKKIAQTKPP